MQAAFTPDQVRVVGRFSDYARVSDEADRREHVFHFCPDCGSQVFYTEPDEPDLIVVSVGAFADPSFPPPTESGYDHRRHQWLAMPATIERPDGWELWAPLRPLYEKGENALACCESLTGRTTDALEHLGRAINISESFRALAKDDSDFDPIRDEPAFEELIGR